MMTEQNNLSGMGVNKSKRKVNMAYHDESGVCGIEIKISSEECVFFLSLWI